MVFNLETFSAIWLYILALINDNEFSEYDISDYYDILIYPSFFLISILIALSSLNFYSAMEKKFSQRKIISGLFRYADIGTSFVEKTVKLEAVGRAIIELLTVFNLGGIEYDKNPTKWFEAQIIPTWIGSMAISAIATYAERRENPIPILGNKEER